MRHLDSLVLLIFVLVVGVGIAIAQNSINPNETLNGTLSTTELTQEYTFSGKAGDSISLNLSSRMFDAYLEITNSNGESIASNDDFGGSLDSTIENFLLPADDDYTIVVTSANGSGIGDFELTFTQLALQTLEFGATLEGQITPENPEVNYQFEGEAGDTILLSMMSPEFDTFIQLSDADFYTLVSDDDGGDGTNSMIIGYTLPATATYFVNARGYSSQARGTFTLQLQRTSFTPLEAQTPLRGKFNHDMHIYSFDVTSGDFINIDVVGDDDLDTSITLRSPAGYVLMSDDDSGDNFNPELHEYFAEEAGTYSVVVQSVSAPTGTYTITLDILKRQLLECGVVQTLNFTSKLPNQVFYIEASDGTNYELVLIGEPSVHSLYVRVYQNNSILVFDETQPSLFEYDITPLEAAEANFVLYNFSVQSADEEVRILISDYNYRTESFTLELVCA